ncbi:hypothetical protein [uncultured Faecalibacterium sp.]|nr:hypothetical protein [uncultured Faecalibacterium sp.]
MQALNGTIPLTIEQNLTAYPDTNGYYGSYLDLYHRNRTVCFQPNRQL